MSIIHVEDVSKTFHIKDGDVQALDHISFDIEKGDIFGIIGLSGAGKSTLVRCLNLLERPTDGKVIVNGQSLSQLSEKELRKARQKIGMIFQHFNLLLQRTVLDNVCFPMEIKGVSKKNARKKALEYLKIVGLEDKAYAYPTQLSGGQKQRVAIARTLASDPEIILCDEATSALDPETTKSILKLLKDINENYGITIVLITHEMAVVQQICHHVAVLEYGHLVEFNTVEELFKHPKTDAAKRLISSSVTQLDEMKEGHLVEVVFNDDNTYEPVIANMILEFQTSVNILKSDIKLVDGKTQGHMLIMLPEQEELYTKMVKYLKDKNLTVREVNE